MKNLKKMNYADLYAFKSLVCELLEKWSQEGQVLFQKDDSELNIVDLKVKEKLGIQYQTGFGVLQEINNEVNRRINEFNDKN